MTKSVCSGIAAWTLLTLISLPSRATELLKVGCPWTSSAVNEQTHNFGFPDTHANYVLALLPTNPTPDTTITISGSYPQVRYFSFQIDDGSGFDNLVDQLPDADLIPVEGGTPDSNPAALPDTGGYSYHYRITVRFEDAPAQREPNTLYAGATQDAYSKKILFRLYLPNPGVNAAGGVPLPTLTYDGPWGHVDLDQTPDGRRCTIIDERYGNIHQLPAFFAVSSRVPRFKPVYSIQSVPFPNADAHYLRSAPGESYADMVVVRAKTPTTPALPPAVVADPDVRYWSICQNGLSSGAVFGCLADTEVVTQSDGYFVTVISPPDKRPAEATADQGYNWLPWGDESDALVALRQILPNPAFPGDYEHAIAAKFLEPISQSLGVWAPEITYCDAATFSANAAAGGETLIQACRAAYLASYRKQ